MSSDDRFTVQVLGDIVHVLSLAVVDLKDNGAVIEAHCGEMHTRTCVDVQDTPAKIVERPARKITAKVGEEANIEVKLNHGSDNVEWKKDGVSVVQSDKMTAKVDGQLCRLTISPVGYEDAGKYDVKVDSSECTTNVEVSSDYLTLSCVFSNQQY